MKNLTFMYIPCSFYRIIFFVETWNQSNFSLYLLNLIFFRMLYHTKKVTPFICIVVKTFKIINGISTERGFATSVCIIHWRCQFWIIKNIVRHPVHLHYKVGSPFYSLMLVSILNWSHSPWLSASDLFTDFSV